MTALREQLVIQKHLSQMLKHQAGTFDMFDLAAATLGYRWVVELRPVDDPADTDG